jgi:hypothetical protein
MNGANMQKSALATREAHLALLDLKKLVDEATESTHAAEFEAVSLAICPRGGGDPLTSLRVVIERLQSSDFEVALSQVREKLEAAVAWHQTGSTPGQ